jgi:uncharacterized membrane protein
MRYIAAYLASAAVFAVIDAAWITLLGPKIYKPIIGEILADTVRIGPAAVFYVLYIAGIVALAVSPALKAVGWRQAAISGAVLGLVAYGTYDLTNQATLKIWATRITALDMAYGALATALAAAVGYLAASWAGRAFAR